MLFISTRAAVSGRTLARRLNSFLIVWNSMCLIRSCKLCQRERRCQVTRQSQSTSKPVSAVLWMRGRGFQYWCKQDLGLTWMFWRRYSLTSTSPLDVIKKNMFVLCLCFEFVCPVASGEAIPHLGFFTCHGHFSQSVASDEYVFFCICTLYCNTWNI